MAKKITVCLLFGGRSGEHEVSLQSAKSVYEALNKERYNVVLVGIDKAGKWLLGNASNYLLNASDPSHIKLNSASASIVTPASSENSIMLMPETGDAKPTTIDVFFPLIHGTTGEDGALQGFLELLDAPYVGAGVLGSAIGMDKDVMKRLLQASGIPVASFRVLHSKTFTIDAAEHASREFGYPVFVKPANMGSSVGVSKAYNKEELAKAVTEAFEYDSKIIIEKYVEGREIECSVLGNAYPEASVPGEIIPTHEFYSYDAKYIDENGAALIIPAKISAEQTKAVQSLAIKAFQVLECSGMARVDCFMKKNGEFIINEINTIPGFTKISMYPKLWEASGTSFESLIDKLIQLSLEKNAEKKKLKRSYTLPGK
ncbi:MAG: D-alanine--D-alanine ligase [Candidatus Parcubacteria bacterium]|jgi:D-alanine-D-alanine ligase